MEINKVISELQGLLNETLGMSSRINSLIVELKENSNIKPPKTEQHKEFINEEVSKAVKSEENADTGDTDDNLEVVLSEDSSKGIWFSFNVDDLEFLLNLEVLVNDFKSLPGYKTATLNSYLKNLRNIVTYYKERGISVVTPNEFMKYPRISEGRPSIILFKKLEYLDYSIDLNTLPSDITKDSLLTTAFLNSLDREYNGMYTNEEILKYLEDFYKYAESHGMQKMNIQTLVNYSAMGEENYRQVLAIFKFNRFLRGLM